MSHTEKPFFDIIIVSFNPGDKLRLTLESVFAQTYQGCRVLIKDGGSTDGSLSFLQSETITDREEVRLLESPDRGIYDAMNMALDGLSNWEKTDPGRHFIYFLNCGDTLAGADVLERVADGILHKEEEGFSGPAIYYGDVFEMKTGQRVSSNPVMDAFACYRNVPCHQACFYSADLFEGQRFDTSLKVRADYEHFLRCFFRLGAGCVYIPVEIACYEGGGFSETRENRKRSKEEHRLVIKRYLSAAEIRRFDRRMLLTLAPLRTRLAETRLTAGIYNRLRHFLYKGKKGCNV